MTDKKLPDLPGSTDLDLKENPYHGFFKKTPRQVWEEAEIHQKKIEEQKKCSHYFHAVAGGYECKNCHIGFTGAGIDIKDGKLFYKGMDFFS